MKGRRHSLETRAKMSASARRNWARDYERLKATCDRGPNANRSLALAKSYVEGRRPAVTTCYGVRTEYGGVTFRSGAEANYAAVLDAFGVKWTYEPCWLLYWAPDGKLHYYVPDFWIQSLGVYIEVGYPAEKKLAKLEYVATYNPGVTVQLVTLEEVAREARRHLES